MRSAAAGAKRWTYSLATSQTGARSMIVARVFGWCRVSAMANAPEPPPTSTRCFTSAKAPATDDGQGWGDDHGEHGAGESLGGVGGDVAFRPHVGVGSAVGLDGRPAFVEHLFDAAVGGGFALGDEAGAAVQRAGGDPECGGLVGEGVATGRAAEDIEGAQDPADALERFGGNLQVAARARRRWRERCVTAR